MPDVIILGAGISGLTAAYRLHQAGKSVLVIEANARPGGMIGSEVIETEVGAFQVETGPNTFPNRGEGLLQLIEELKLNPVSASAAAKNRYVYLNGELQTVPANPIGLVTTELLSKAGKKTLLTEPFRPYTGEAKSDESIADFIERRLGREVLDHLASPFLTGIYAGDPNQLSAPAVFPKLWEWEQTHGSLTKGALMGAFTGSKNTSLQPKRKKQPYELQSFEGGLETLPQTLAKKLPPGAIRYNTACWSVERSIWGSYRVFLNDGSVLETDELILATPAWTAAKLLEAFSPDLAHTLKQIPYVGLSSVHIGLPKTQLPSLNGFGFLVPRLTGLDLLGSIWTSSLFPKRAPKDHVLLSNFIGGALAPEVSTWRDEEILSTVLEDLQTIFKAPSPLTPVFSKLYRWENAIPQYNLGHTTLINTLERMTDKAFPGLHFVGNYLHGIALNHCIEQATQVSERILKNPCHHTVKPQAAPPPQPAIALT